MARRRRERMSVGKKNIIAGLRKRLRAYAGCYRKVARQISECNETPGRKLGCHIADVQIFSRCQKLCTQPMQ